MALQALILSALFVAAGTQQQAEHTDFCDLLRQPERFDGHLVVFEASNRYGFEWDEIFCISCLGPQRVWLEVKDEPSKRLNRQLKRLPKHSATLNATFTGIFRSKPGAFGDGGYKYQLDLLGLENIEIVSKKSPAPEYLPPKEKKRLHRCNASPPSR